MRKCKVSFCDRETRIGDLCGGHYQQAYAGKPFMPLRKRSTPGTPSLRDTEGRKLCIECSTWQMVSQFCVSVKASDGLHQYCKACMKNKKYVARYGITSEQVAALKAKQNWCCKLCGIHEDSTEQGLLYVDHDHSHCTAKNGCPDCVRGLLCRDCNIGIGHFHDDVALMALAIEYIRLKGNMSAVSAA